MATIPQSALPLFYRDLLPLSSALHGDWRLRLMEDVRFLAATNAIPLLAEEIIVAQRFYPVVFSLGDEPVPLALMGLSEGVNAFVDADGRFPDGLYIPAYVRRYPFILARLQPDAEDLSLCIDPSAGAAGPFDEGDAIFEGGEPSERTRGVLAFCEQFEQGTQLTSAFVRELQSHKLLSEGEFTVSPQDGSPGSTFRGFQMVSEDALKALRGDVARKLIGSGAMPLVYAHIFSLWHMAGLAERQNLMGRMPAPDGAAAPAPFVAGA